MKMMRKMEREPITIMMEVDMKVINNIKYIEFFFVLIFINLFLILYFLIKKGDWKNDKRNGKGTLYYDIGDRYEGNK